MFWHTRQWPSKLFREKTTQFSLIESWRRRRSDPKCVHYDQTSVLTTLWVTVPISVTTKCVAIALHHPTNYHRHDISNLSEVVFVMHQVNQCNTWQWPMNSKSTRRQRRIDFKFSFRQVRNFTKPTIWNRRFTFQPRLQCTEDGNVGFWHFGIRGSGLQGFGNAGKHRFCSPVLVVAGLASGGCFKEKQFTAILNLV